MPADYAQFLAQVDRLAATRKPVRTRADIKGTLAAKRNFRIAIREAALRGVTCVILYRKTTANEVKRYEVIPTEYAYKRMKGGLLRKILWVQDVRDDKRTKSLYLRNILKAVLTDRRLKSKWPIKIR